jgi:two-component system, LytTR family, sensor kinase
MSRRVVWLQLLIGWLPVWALVMVLMVVAHPQIGMRNAALGSLRMIMAAALLGFVVQRFVERHPWPARVAPRFVAMHLLAATVYSVSWLVLSSGFASLVEGALVLAVGPSTHATLVMGVWLYVMIAGVSYTTQTTERAARAEANAAKAQLAALRSQINPHFLFNALHTVVQLIPREPKQAAQAAEQLAALLRTAIEEDRDVVSVAEELAFVEKYLAIERIRFGDRLQVTMHVKAEARDATVPTFAVQTLVENAVRHGAAPRVEPTAVSIEASVGDGRLSLTVRDTGGGATEEHMRVSTGTGLRRLRERLGVLYGDTATLDVSSNGGGLVATLGIPQEPGS